jgi:hypothetical protein
MYRNLCVLLKKISTCLLLLGAVSADRHLGSAANNIERVTVRNYIVIKTLALVVLAAGSNNSVWQSEVRINWPYCNHAAPPLYICILLFLCMGS